ASPRGFLIAGLGVTSNRAPVFSVRLRSSVSPCDTVSPSASLTWRVGGSRMISFSKVSKQYGRQVLFVDASFQLNPGEKVGLVGPNGSGKTTLFRMIVGEETADEG